MSIDWASEAEKFFGELPHPQAPTVKVKELPTAIKMATKARAGGHATFQEAAAFHQEFTAMNQRLQAQGKLPMAPEEWEHILDRLAPVSHAYHGRPPTMYEIQQHRESTPAQVRDYYGQLPDKHYPDVPSADMVKFLALADQAARQHIGRAPNKLEARTFAHAAMGYDAIQSYYRSLAQEKNGGEDPSQRDPSAVGAAPAGGQSSDPRAVRSGLGRSGTAASGQDGVSQG